MLMRCSSFPGADCAAAGARAAGGDEASADCSGIVDGAGAGDGPLLARDDECGCADDNEEDAKSHGRLLSGARHAKRLPAPSSDFTPTLTECIKSLTTRAELLPAA